MSTMAKKLVYLLLVIAVSGVTAYFAADFAVSRKINEGNVVVQTLQTGSDSKTETRRIVTTAVPNFSDAAETCVQAVVYVKVTQKAKVQQPTSILDLLFGFPQTPKEQVGLGSGVIIRSDGYIVTNNHVIAGADVIEVTLEDNRVFPATLIGTDPATDIALLKIDATDLPTVLLGDSDSVRLGEWVLAIGSPYDLRSTITAGIVSAKGRALPNYDGQYRVESFIQTDAAVNPGNSGGALVNALGELIGINTSIISLTGSYTGYSFAVPVNIVKKITDDFIEYGSVQRAMLGVSIAELTQQMAQQLGLESTSGAYVAQVKKGGAADRAGIREGDVITEINLNKVDTPAALQERINRLRPGEQAVVTVIRSGATKEFIITF